MKKEILKVEDLDGKMVEGLKKLEEKGEVLFEVYRTWSGGMGMYGIGRGWRYRVVMLRNGEKVRRFWWFDGRGNFVWKVS